MVDLDNEAAQSTFQGGATEPMNEPAASCVAILLSTYNGERFLNEQLSSYTAQHHSDWLLYWRDDGSADGTKAMMDAFAQGPGSGRCIQIVDGGRLLVT